MTKDTDLDKEPVYVDGYTLILPDGVGVALNGQAAHPVSFVFEVKGVTYAVAMSPKDASDIGKRLIIKGKEMIH